MEYSIKDYRSLGMVAGMGSLLGSGIIVSLGVTLSVWEAGLNLSVFQVGLVSGILTFAIAFGSLFTGNLTKKFGLITLFNWLNFIYAIGALACIFAFNFPMLLIGSIIMGFTSGVDLPVSLTVLSKSSPNEEVSAKLVSSSQVYWQIGVFLSFIASFIVSGIDGLIGARIVFTVLFFISIITWLWRIKSKKLQAIRSVSNENLDISESADNEVSMVDFFRRKGLNQYFKIFIAIVIFYVFWNLLANTFGQFQTYVLTNTGATQTQATGLGILLNVVTLIINIIFSTIASGKYRNTLFVIGNLIQFAGMFGMAVLSQNGNFLIIASAIAINNLGGPFAGEAIYKVWTQETFPSNVRASIQGFINGFSRFCCGLLALITPWLVAPERIQMSMYIFASFVVISGIAGVYVIKAQKKVL